MRPIDGDRLYEKAADLEAVALVQVEKYMHSDDLDNIVKWKIWSAILAERSAFKFDVADAPTIGEQDADCID